MSANSIKGVLENCQEDDIKNIRAKVESIPKTHEKTEILNSRLHQIFNASLTPIVKATEGKEADEKMMEDGESKIGNVM